MFKDMVIASLGAAVALQIPWFAVCDVATKCSIGLALFVCLLFFCLFCEEKHEKWLKRKKRAEKLQDRVSRLRYEGGNTDERHGAEAACK